MFHAFLLFVCRATQVVLATEIIIDGYCRRLNDSQVVGNVPLQVKINLRGSIRTFNLNTYTSGYFFLRFQPSTNEGGIYHIGMFFLF